MSKRVFKRKIYDAILDWKQKSNGQKNSREHYLNRPRSNGDPHGQMAMMWLCSTLLK